MSDETPWIRLDLEGVNPSIKGNLAGLKHLRDKLDEAISEERSLMEDFDCNFNQIHVVHEYPKVRKEGFGFRLLMIFCGVVAILGLAALAVILIVIFSGFSAQ